MDQWLSRVLREHMKFVPGNVVVLERRDGRHRCDCRQRPPHAGAFRSRLPSHDLLLVVLIGHGTFDGADAKFNLVGPDLESAEWAALFERPPLPCRRREHRVRRRSRSSSGWPVPAGSSSRRPTRRRSGSTRSFPSSSSGRSRTTPRISTRTAASRSRGRHSPPRPTPVRRYYQRQGPARDRAGSARLQRRRRRS